MLFCFSVCRCDLHLRATVLQLNYSSHNALGDVNKSYFYCHSLCFVSAGCVLWVIVAFLWVIVVFHESLLCFFSHCCFESSLCFMSHFCVLWVSVAFCESLLCFVSYCCPLWAIVVFCNSLFCFVSHGYVLWVTVRFCELLCFVSHCFILWGNIGFCHMLTCLSICRCDVHLRAITLWLIYSTHNALGDVNKKYNRTMDSVHYTVGYNLSDVS